MNEDSVRIVVDGVEHNVSSRLTVATALMNLGVAWFRTSVTGEAREPLCGMGTCHECRATVAGVAHRRTCLMSVRDGMRIETSTQ